MSAEELIIAVTNEASSIQPVAYKLLWALISLALQRGSNVVQVSMQWLSLYTGASRAGLVLAIGQLDKYVEVDSTSGKVTTFRLPEAWMPPQGPLFGGSGPITARRPSLPQIRMPGPTPTGNLSNGQAGYQAGTYPIIRQVWPVTCLPTRQVLSNGQAGLPQTCPTSVQVPIRNAHARAESSRVEDSAGTEEYLVVEKAFHTVEIRPDQREDAEILSAILQDFRSYFDSDARASSRPDRKVLARLLAIASVEVIAETLQLLHHMDKRPGNSDMWFFVVLFDKIHGIDSTICSAVFEREKAKAQSHEPKPSLFQEELVKATAAKTRRLA